MSLPFADKPEESSIYQDLRVSKLADLTATDFDAFRARMDAQGTEGLEDEYRRLLLLSLAANQSSISGPIPGTAQIYVHTIDSNAQQTIFQPAIGEVWQLVGISFTRTAGTGSSVYTMYLGDGVNDVYWFYSSSSDTATAFTADSNFPDMPMYFDNGLYLSGGVSNGTTGGGIGGSWKVALIRVR
tara:strand:+ start:913 stop:1467 length:555 start_codon:yes stop_codon:yes gene_type:complete